MAEKNKAIRVDTPADHPDIKTFTKLMKKDREKAKKEFPVMSKIFGRDAKTDKKKAKRFIDTMQTIGAKKRTETEGSFKSGGPVCKLAKKGKGRAYGKNS
jgi:hypothetical protein